MVVELTSREEESRTQDVQLGAWRDRIEILHTQSVHGGTRVVHGQLVKIAILTLDEEEEHAILHIAGLKGRVAGHEEPSRLNMLVPKWDCAFSIIMVHLLVH